MATLPLILIVDDRPANIEVLAEALAGRCDVRFALSGTDALALVATQLPDLILLDVMMPGMDGYEVIEALKRDPQTQNVPVIFVTAKSDSDSETRALQAGAVDFIHKPVNADVARARVQLQLDLLARQRELHQLNADLERRVIERTQALRDALVRAEVAQRAKSAFLANMSHELRTPLNAILGMAYLVGQQVGNTKMLGQVTTIQAAGQRLLGLVSQILDMSSLEAGKVQIEQMEFGLSAVFDAAEGALQERMATKGLRLVREIDPALPATLLGDPRRMGHILANFLSNAVAFSEHGQVTARAQLVETRGEQLLLRLEVQDEGSGVDPQHKGAIFNTFEQADNSRTRRHGGAGLGLAICKQLAELMGGQVGMAAAPVHGSVFWATLLVGRGQLLEAEPGAINWAETRQVLEHLSELLAWDDAAAQSLWHSHTDALGAVLAERKSAFTLAMAQFDFDAALKLLQSAGAECPELQS